MSSSLSEANTLHSGNSVPQFATILRDTVEDLDSKRSVPCGDCGELSSLRDVVKDINTTDSSSASARGSSGTLYADQVGPRWLERT